MYKNLLYNEALNSNWFNSISVYGPQDLDDEFKTRFKDILNLPRGSGYWIWKVYIINKKLDEIKEGDILIYLDAGQFHSTILIMKKNNNLINIIKNYYKILYTNPLLFTDYYNNNQQNYFIDNRHDQSVFSILRKLYGSMLLNDETWFQPFGNISSLAYPFWGTRRREI